MLLHGATTAGPSGPMGYAMRTGSVMRRRAGCSISASCPMAAGRSMPRAAPAVKRSSQTARGKP